ncbi:resistance protein [Trifolium pratense]|uniref:Resistance protein n=1 Tax=Trifolium pratense TaxID=57577 RepID=A0A2K3PRG1_TRIPR|nr:resistance protein [Trifolium pratense]
MYEHVFIGKIVEEVLKKITLGITLHVGDYLVGLEPQKQRLISLLNVGSDDTVHMVGIHGIGGIGKTTLALEVYNSTVHQFQCSCFLKVRENYHKNGLVLQKILLSQIVEKNIEINSVEEGISILQKILSKNKVLLLLDDVDNEKQLQAIAGKPNWFGLGSRVIITTRNQRLLTLHGVEAEHTYEVKELNDKDAFELVRWNAFKNEKTDRVFSGYAHVLDRAVAYASGLPLALEVIGSHFSNRTIEECKCALDQCERVLDEKIQMTLQLSFDDLKKEEKIVFLDIACCLKGYKLTTVEQILRAHHGYSIRNHINVLVEKSLIKISEFGNVTLHDLIEDMGKDIVRQESPNPGERSRLWDSDDIEEVLKENKVSSFESSRCRDIKSVPPLNCPSLIELDLSYCANLESFPLMVNGFRGQLKLKILRLINCRKIKIIPLIMLDSLEELNLRGCTNLKTIPPLKLASFEELDLSYCTTLESFPHVVDGFLGKLKTLLLTNCHNLKSIPPIKLDSLEKVDFSNCHLLERYSILGNLNLPKRDAVLSMNPTPSSRVEYICHENCKVSLDYLSDRLLMFANVTELHLTKNRITVLPKSIKEFKFLSRLILDDCKELQEIQEIPPSLKSLSALNCQALTSSCKTKLLNQVMI